MLISNIIVTCYIVIFVIFYSNYWLKIILKL